MIINYSAEKFGEHITPIGNPFITVAVSKQVPLFSVAATTNHASNSNAFWAITIAQCIAKAVDTLRRRLRLAYPVNLLRICLAFGNESSHLKQPTLKMVATYKFRDCLHCDAEVKLKQLQSFATR